MDKRLSKNSKTHTNSINFLISHLIHIKYIHVQSFYIQQKNVQLHNTDTAWTLINVRTVLHIINTCISELQQMKYGVESSYAISADLNCQYVIIIIKDTQD